MRDDYHHKYERISELGGHALLGLDTIEGYNEMAHTMDLGWNLLRGDISVSWVVDRQLLNDLDDDDSDPAVQRAYQRLLDGGRKN